MKKLGTLRKLRERDTACQASASADPDPTTRPVETVPLPPSDLPQPFGVQPAGMLRDVPRNNNKKVPRSCLTRLGTPYTACPEIWLEKEYNSKGDIWSLGCVLYARTHISYGIVVMAY